MSGLLTLVKDDDIERAKGYLALAGQTPGSPQLSSFGPNMMLAKALLERGEFDCVEVYLEQCTTFWISGIETLNAWRSQVREHQIPDFGANLTY